MQFKLVNAHGYGAYENFIKDLIVGGVFGRADVEDFPFEIILEGLETFEGNFEGEWGEELGWVV
jgi:hypothetical protein